MDFPRITLMQSLILPGFPGTGGSKDHDFFQLTTINANSLGTFAVFFDLAGERSPLPLKAMLIYTGFIHSKQVKLLSRNCQLTQP